MDKILHYKEDNENKNYKDYIRLDSKFKEQFNEEVLVYSIVINKQDTNQFISNNKKYVLI